MCYNYLSRIGDERMIKRIKIFVFVLLSVFLFPVVSYAETKTYNICKSGCDYDSLVPVWYDINTLTTDADVVVNFKDSGSYTFMDWNYFDLIAYGEVEQLAHITNNHVKSVQINGDTKNNTTINVIDIQKDTLREWIVNYVDPYNDNILESSIPGQAVEIELIEKKNAEIQEVLDQQHEDVNRYIWSNLKDYVSQIVGTDISPYYYRNNQWYYGYYLNHTYINSYEKILNYDSKFPYATYANTIYRELNTKYNGYGYSKTSYRNGVCKTYSVVGNTLTSTELTTSACQNYKAIIDNIKNLFNRAYNEFDVSDEIAAIDSKYENMDYNLLIAQKKEDILAGNDEIVEFFLDFFESGTFDPENYINKYYADNEEADLNFLNYIPEEMFDTYKNTFGYVYETLLTDDELLFMRFMFTGIVNADFEINHINYVGSPYFASSGNKVNGVMNNCSIPSILLVGGNVEVHVKDSLVNRIYSIGTSGMDSEQCTGEDLCGDPTVYLTYKDRFANPVRRFSEDTFEKWEQDLKTYYTDTLFGMMERIDPNDYLDRETCYSNYFACNNLKQFMSYVEQYGLDSIAFYTLESGEYYCDFDYGVCYDAQNDNYYALLENYSEEDVNSLTFVFEGFDNYLRNSLMVELSGGVIYYESDEEVVLEINDTSSLRNLFNYIVDNNMNDVSWVIEDPSIAKIVDGEIVALKIGETTATAVQGRDTFKVTIRVTNANNFINPQTGGTIIFIFAVLFILITVTVVIRRNKKRLSY